MSIGNGRIDTLTWDSCSCSLENIGVVECRGLVKRNRKRSYVECSVIECVRVGLKVGRGMKGM